MNHLVVIGLLVAFIVVTQAASVTPFTGCSDNAGSCQVYSVLYPNDNTLLAMMRYGRIYRSNDEGQTWSILLTGATSMQSYPTNPNYVVFQLQSGAIRKSTDGGNTTSSVTALPSGASVYDVVVHPNKVGTLMATACPGACQVYYSLDYGVTWQSGPSSLSYLYTPMWSEDPATPYTIFGITTARAFGFANLGGTWVTLFQNSIGFVITTHYLYVGIQQGAGAKLYSSSNRLDPSHTDARYYWLDEFPSGNNLAELGYTFLDDTTRSAYIGVKQNVAGMGTVYSSDFDGDQFVKTLDFVAEDGLYYDFDKFAGLGGIYFANAYKSTSSKNVQTYATYDNGGDWNLIPAPKVDYNGVPINCSISNGCSLHLHGILSWVNGIQPPYYTSPNAIGIMMAIGNIGTSLTTNNVTAGKTYLSRDAGFNWVELFSEPTIYEFGDHGGLLVFATTSTPTTNVHYSTNEGTEVTTFKFTSGAAIYVDNIISEPTGTGRRFVLLGHNSANQYYIYGLDFTDLNLPLCADSDYEFWEPSNGDNENSNCFMGQITYYTRRKQDSRCYNNRDTDHAINQTACVCAWEDYECDVDFSPSTRNSTDGFTCTPTTSVPSCATGYRLIPDTACTTGELNLLSNNCVGYSGTPTLGTSTTSSGSGGLTTGGSPTSTSGTSARPNTVTGQSTTGEKKKSGSGGVVFVVILFVFIFGGAAAVGVLYWKNDKFRDFVQEKLFRRDPGYGRLNTDINGDDEAEPN